MPGHTYGKQVVPPGCYFFTLLLVGSLVGAVGQPVPILVIGRGIYRQGDAAQMVHVPCHAMPYSCLSVTAPAAYLTRNRIAARTDVGWYMRKEFYCIRYAFHDAHGGSLQYDFFFFVYRTAEDARERIRLWSHAFWMDGHRSLDSEPVKRSVFILS